MSAASAQLGFAAEFVLFLAAVAGLGVVVRAKMLTGERRGQLLLALGFIAVGVAAFLHGSLLQPDAAAPSVLVTRLVGLGLLGAGSLRSGDAPPRRQVGPALALLFVAEVATVLSLPADV
ncbi:MAG: hypothetical protein KY438_09695, partial [Actinobacteria bacterium]|nr:hypothetical protein [Actinomycetota bacterium]